MSEKELSLKLSVEEINRIMTALGNLPYIQVYTLINKIQQQVGEQMNIPGKEELEKMGSNGSKQQ